MLNKFLYNIFMPFVLNSLIVGSTNYNESQSKLRNRINFYYKAYTFVKENTN